MSSFEDILNRPAEAIERPKPIPSGWYNLIVKKFDKGTLGKNNTPVITYTFGIISPDEGVDENEFQEFGGMAKLSEREHKHNFFVTDDAVWRLKEFVEVACNVNTSGRSLGPCLPETINLQVKAEFSIRPNKDDPKQLFSEIKNFAPA